MYYEIYLDSIFILNVVMNFLCLELVNRFCFGGAARWRILAGAMLGAVFYVLPFWVPGPGWLKIWILLPMAVLGMLRVTFRLDLRTGLWEMSFLLLFVSCSLGGAVLFFKRLIGRGKAYFAGSGETVFWGLFLFFVAGYLIRNKKEDICNVEIWGKGAKVTVRALVDSGNGLYEPFSGSPVCLMEKNVFQQLWQRGKPDGLRVIPYHSVGKEKGILYGYPLPRMVIHNRGIKKEYRNFYVGILDGALSAEGGYCMLLHPQMLSGDTGTWQQKKQRK